MLSIENLRVAYGPVQALAGISLEVPKGQIVSIIGSNGAGKTTLLNTICALVRQKSGTIQFEGRELSRSTHQVVKLGIMQVPEGRKVFAGLTVRENLMAGGYTLTDGLSPPAKYRKDVRPVSHPAGTAGPAGRHPERRRAADAGHLPGADGRAEADPAR